MPSPAAQQRGSCCSSMFPGPVSSKAEHTFPTGTYIATHRMQHIYAYICGQPHRSTKTETHKCNNHQQSYPVPCSSWSGRKTLSRNYIFIYRYICNVDSCSSWSLTLGLSSNCHHPLPPGPQVSPVAGTWAREPLRPKAPLQPLVHRLPCTHTTTPPSHPTHTHYGSLQLLAKKLSLPPSWPWIFSSPAAWLRHTCMQTGLLAGP